MDFEFYMIYYQIYKGNYEMEFPLFIQPFNINTYFLEINYKPIKEPHLLKQTYYYKYTNIFYA